MRPHLPMLFAAALLTDPAAAQDDAFVTFQVLKPEIAIKAAISAMEACRTAGYQVGVTVVDRFGNTQIFVRDRFAGLHVEETAYRKAWTAVSFREDTLSLDVVIEPGSQMQGIRDISVALPLGGGVPVESAGSIVAGIGVSGAPSPEFDDTCARAGIEAIEDDIGF